LALTLFQLRKAVKGIKWPRFSMIRTCGIQSVRSP
jgi:hypothetical protein